MLACHYVIAGLRRAGFTKKLVVKIDAPAAPEQEAFVHHAESRAQVQASAARVFEHLDDHTRLSAHMSRRSWRMGWSRTKLSLDQQAGRAAGSRIRLEGGVLGAQLSLEEVITEHKPPIRKVWMTVDAPRLLVIGAYRMGFMPGSGHSPCTKFCCDRESRPARFSAGGKVGRALASCRDDCIEGGSV